MRLDELFVAVGNDACVELEQFIGRIFLEFSSELNEQTLLQGACPNAGRVEILDDV